MAGLQPLFQIKAIYSNSTIGSITADLLTKQIMSNQFTFPINIDYKVSATEVRLTVAKEFDF